MDKEILAWIAVIGLFSYFIGSFIWALCGKEENETEHKLLVTKVNTTVQV